MKKFIFVFAVMATMAGAAHAVTPSVWRSSNTATNTGVTNLSVTMLCNQNQRGILHGVCTNFGVASASVTIVNSTYTVAGVSKIGPISTLVADQCKYYDTMMPNGMGFFKPNTADISILYHCY